MAFRLTSWEWVMASRAAAAAGVTPSRLAKEIALRELDDQAAGALGAKRSVRAKRNIKDQEIMISFRLVEEDWINLGKIARKRAVSIPSIIKDKLVYGE